MKTPITVSLDLPHDFSGREQALVVQKLPAGTPLGCKAGEGSRPEGDCPLPAEWIVFIASEADPHRGGAGLACQEHVAGLMWAYCSG